MSEGSSRQRVMYRRVSALWLSSPIVRLLHREEPDPFVPEAGLHGLLREEDHGVVHLQGDGVGGAVGGGLGGLVGQYPPHLHVRGKALGPEEEGPVRIHPTNAVCLPAGLSEGPGGECRR